VSVMNAAEPKALRWFYCSLACAQVQHFILLGASPSVSAVLHK